MKDTIKGIGMVAHGDGGLSYHPLISGDKAEN
jgi:hypothetical protein